ncbi:hypothetical protein NL676_018041 [Syzygium grande]|nr:hypothetical protein NL676_018041 [Syzygium grande]
MYNTAMEAVMAYDKASRQLCGTDAITNFPSEHSALDSLPPSRLISSWWEEVPRCEPEAARDMDKKDARLKATCIVVAGPYTAEETTMAYDKAAR